MAEQTNIGWTDSTFNAWQGCTKVSDGCEHCYASVSTPVRAQGIKWGAGQPRKRTSEAYWKQPLRWNADPFYACQKCTWRGDWRVVQDAEHPEGFYPPNVGHTAQCPACHEAALIPARRRVFCASLSDVFDNEVPERWRFDLLNLIADTPQLDWLLLTKRIGNAKAMLDAFCESDGNIGEKWAGWPNVWLGITVINQAEADRDIPKLLEVPAAIRFLSMEPLLGPVDFYKTSDAIKQRPHPWLNGPILGGIDWVIVGGESDQPGMKARRFDPEWAAQIIAQCKHAGVPVFMKQFGSDPTHIHPGTGHKYDDMDDPVQMDAMCFELQRILDSSWTLDLKHRAGADPLEWPEVFRVQEHPQYARR